MNHPRILFCSWLILIVGWFNPVDAHTTLQGPIVTITAQDDSVIESSTGSKGVGTGVLVVTRQGSTLTPLTVKYKVSGTAISGIDYAALSGEVIIRSGSSSAPIAVLPVNDDVFEGDKTVVVTLIPSNARPQTVSTGTLLPTSYVVASPSAATVTILEDETQVSLEATDQEATEFGQGSGTFKITRAGPVNTSLVVSYSVMGDAANGTDYELITDSVTIPTRSASVSIAIKPYDDAVAEKIERVFLKLRASPKYLIGSEGPNSVAIIDNDSVITVTASEVKVAERGGGNTNFVLKRAGNLSAPLSVHLLISGDAANGVDYDTIPSQVGFNVNSSEVLIPVKPKADWTKENSEVIVLRIAENKRYTIGNPGSASIAIEENPSFGGESFTLSPNQTTLVTVHAEVENTREGIGRPAVVLIKRTGSLAFDLDVPYQIGGSGTNGLDYERLPSLIKIPAGQASARVEVKALRDSLEEGSETVTITILSTVAVLPERSFQAAAPSTSTITIRDSRRGAP